MVPMAPEPKQLTWWSSTTPCKSGQGRSLRSAEGWVIVRLPHWNWLAWQMPPTQQERRYLKPRRNANFSSTSSIWATGPLSWIKRVLSVSEMRSDQQPKHGESRTGCACSWVLRKDKWEMLVKGLAAGSFCSHRPPPPATVMPPDSCCARGKRSDGTLMCG